MIEFKSYYIQHPFLYYFPYFPYFLFPLLTRSLSLFLLGTFMVSNANTKEISCLLFYLLSAARFSIELSTIIEMITTMIEKN